MAKKHHFLTFFNKKQQIHLTVSSGNKEESSKELFFNFIESETADSTRMLRQLTKD